MKKNWHKMFCTGLVGFALMAGGVAKAEAEKEVTLAPVVVTATRIEQSMERVPANLAPGACWWYSSSPYLLP